jgi:hypothetical protein
LKPTATDEAISCSSPDQPNVDNNGNALVVVNILFSAEKKK